MRGAVVVGALTAFFKQVWLCAAEVAKWNACSAPRGRDCCVLALLLLLVPPQRTQAYFTVPMNGLCKQTGLNYLSLSPSSAIRLLLDTSGGVYASCKMEIVAPETHSISLLHTRRKKLPDRRKSGGSPSDDRRKSHCLLTVSSPFGRFDDEVKFKLDLCSEEVFTTPDVAVLPPRITLEWNTTARSADEILVSEIVVSALGKGSDVCFHPGQLYCNPKYPVYCISKQLVCDGKRNCPEGDDEEEEMCSMVGNLEKAAIVKPNENSHFGQDWELVASEVIKKLRSKDTGHLRRSDVASTTERSMVIWSDDESLESDEPESLPDVLKHYGPWGYLMLGMLICGTVLMFCGLWECCCRKPKSSSNSTAGPTLLIINQGAQQSDVEAPQTPGPPRYEDLDQPPSYAALFPSSKAPDTQTNCFPITIPIVDSLSNLLTSSSQPNQNANNLPENTGLSTSGSGQAPDVFTIGLHGDLSSRESNPK